MNRHKDLMALTRLAQMLRDIELAQVAQAARARQDSLDRLADLAAPRPSDALEPVTAAQAALRYEVWADQRRAEIRPVLERQTQALAQAQEKARTALGRADVLSKLAKR